MERKINYQKQLFSLLDELKQQEVKPHLLLHVCCGPCFVIPFRLLKDYFQITILFYNPNIYPTSEYNKRRDELLRYLDLIHVLSEVTFIEHEENHSQFMNDLIPYQDEKEGGIRCQLCIQKRLTHCYQYAKKNGYDYLGCVMTISRYKNATMINKIGEELSHEFGIKYLNSDFKKNNGYEDMLVIAKECQLYCQKYCGCEYSYRDLMTREKALEAGRKSEE